MSDSKNASFAKSFQTGKDHYPIFDSEIQFINRRRKNGEKFTISGWTLDIKNSRKMLCPARSACKHSIFHMGST
jgi:hypothetical protein